MLSKTYFVLSLLNYCQLDLSVIPFFPAEWMGWESASSDDTDGNVNTEWHRVQSLESWWFHYCIAKLHSPTSISFHICINLLIDGFTSHLLFCHAKYMFFISSEFKISHPRTCVTQNIKNIVLSMSISMLPHQQHFFFDRTEDGIEDTYFHFRGLVSSNDFSECLM